MLFHLVSWILLVVSAIAVGSAILSIIGSSAFSHFGDRMLTAIWLGLLTIATVLLGISVFLPLSPVVGFGVLAGLTIGSASLSAVRKDFNTLRSCCARSLPLTLSLGSLVVVSAFSSTRLVEVYDTGLYHYQLTRWLAEYGTIRGLALIHIVLGFSSSWFALAAPFDFGPFQGRVAGLLGGLAIFLCLLHFALAVSRIIQRRAERPDWFLVGGYTVILGVCLAWAFEVSLSPDVPSWILAMLVAWLMLITYRSGDSASSAPDGSAILPFVLAIGAGGVKLSAGPAAVVALIFYWLNSPSKWISRLLAPGIVGLLLLPKAATGAVSSGCPFFPSPALCLDVPWGFGAAAARVASDNIRDWARWSGPEPAWADNWNWMHPWISHLDRLALILFCAICFLGFIALRGWRAGRSFAYVLALAVFSSVFLFITAPNPRFGAGYLALYPALFLAVVGPSLWNFLSHFVDSRKPSTSSNVLAYALIAMAMLFAADAGVREIRLRRELRNVANLSMPSDSSLRSRFLLPPVLAKSEGDLIIIKNRRMDLLVPLNLTTERTNGLEYLHPKEGDQCWGASIPCLPRALDGDVVLRFPNDGLRYGFTRSPNLDKLSKSKSETPGAVRHF